MVFLFLPPTTLAFSVFILLFSHTEPQTSYIYRLHWAYLLLKLQRYFGFIQRVAWDFYLSTSVKATISLSLLNIRPFLKSGLLISMQQRLVLICCRFSFRSIERALWKCPPSNAPTCWKHTHYSHGSNSLLSVNIFRVLCHFIRI